MTTPTEPQGEVKMDAQELHEIEAEQVLLKFLKNVVNNDRVREGFRNGWTIRGDWEASVANQKEITS